MILLSKVFPTLDCASCISTPKMASTIHHPNITPMVYSRVDQVRRTADGTFRATVTQKARFVDIDACTGCQKCETACTVAVPDQFNADLVARRAAHITFPQAVPKKAVIDRAGSSPCSFACPAGIQAHGYVSLIRSGLDEEAYRLVLQATPLVGTLGRACYAPCEGECTRGSLEGTLPIRRLKRFASDRHDASGNGNGLERPEPNGKRVAIVGSGPTGLTAAFQLAPPRLRRQGLRGGARRRRLPAARHPVLSAARGRRRARHRERHGARRRDRGRPPGGRPGGAQGGRLRRGPRRDRHPPLARAWASRARTASACWAARSSCARSSSARPMDLDGQARGRRRRRQRRDGRGARRPPPRRRERDRRLPPLPGARCPRTTWSRPTPSGRAWPFRLLVAPAEVAGRRRRGGGGPRCTEMRLGAPDASGRRSVEAGPGLLGHHRRRTWSSRRSA